MKAIRTDTLAALRLKHAKLRNLLQLMLDVAENCDETGYVDGMGFVNLDKLHRKVRRALKSGNENHELRND